MGSPIIGLGGSDSSAAAAATGLREALAQHQQLAQQQQRQQQVQQHQSLLDQIDIMSKGGIPAEVVTNSPTAPGMKVRSPNPALPANADQSRIVSTDSGRYYIPTDQEREKAKQPAQDDTNSFALSPTTAGAMNEYYGDGTFKAGQRLPLAHASLATEAVKAHLSKNALDDTNSLSVTDDASQRLEAQGIHIKAGARIPIEHATNAIDLAKIAFPPPAKPDASQIIPGMVGPGGGPLLLDKNKASASEVPIPAGSKPQESEAAKDRQQRFNQGEQDRKDARGQRQQDLQQKGQDSAQKTLDALQTKEQEQHAKRQAYGTALATKDGGDVVDPDTRGTHPMNPARRKFYQDRYDQATSLAGTYADQQKKIITRNGGDTGQTGQPAAPATAAKPATNGQQTGKKQAVTIDHVRNYAKAKGVSEAQAIKEFKSYGYPIGQ